MGDRLQAQTFPLRKSSPSRLLRDPPAPTREKEREKERKQRESSRGRNHGGGRRGRREQERERERERRDDVRTFLSSRPWSFSP
eukprot:2754110-Pyramimonas_sp.AAC.1